tara:strand:- start:774 stop:1487 length:714 start_codon:yes stop_codon:yes gene_type:complete
MATTTATITIASADLLSDELALTTSATLTTAGTSTGVTQASGLSRKTVVGDPAKPQILYRAGDYTAEKANKVYIKNTSVTAAEFFTVQIDQEVIGRLYAGDWMFMPWIATSGTKETFVVSATGTVAAGDSWDFDGVTTVSADATLNNFATAVNAKTYPNWTTAVSSAAVTFTARYAGAAGVVTGTTAITGDTVTDLADSNFTMPITSGAVGTRSESDISILPSVVTAMTYETMLIHE